MQTGLAYHAGERYVLFSGGFTEVGFILFIAFLLFGPKKLPEIARVLGKGMGELRRASNELKSSLEEEIRNLDRKDEEEVSYSGQEYSEPEYSHQEYSEAEYPEHEYSEHGYSEHEAHPYTEMEEEGFDHPEETHELNAESAETNVGGQSEAAEQKLSEQSEGDLEPAPEYGYDYSESPQQEPEPRPRG